jgi:hypothetical protein
MRCNLGHLKNQGVTESWPIWPSPHIIPGMPPLFNMADPEEELESGLRETLLVTSGPNAGGNTTNDPNYFSADQVQTCKREDWTSRGPPPPRHPPPRSNPGRVRT